jgi:transglutaminase-like putative cysteine protease
LNFLLLKGSSPVKKHLGFVAVAIAVCAAQTVRAESWESIYLGGTKAGFTHVKVEPVKERNGRKLVRVTVETVLNLQRGRDTTVIRTQYETLETEKGDVLRLETRVLSGPSEQRTRGEVRGGKLHITLDAGGSRQEQDVPWAADVRGPYAAELSLSREPMQPGETRRVRIFIPLSNKIGTTVLTARDFESVELAGGVKRDLLRIESKLTDENGNIIADGSTTYWVDTAGQIIKSFTDVFGGQVTYRTSKRVATAPAQGKLDLLKESIIALKKPIPNAQATRSMTYRVRLQDDDPLEVFPNDRRQTALRENDAHTITLMVKTAGPMDGKGGAAKIPDEYLRSNTQVNSTDENVINHMQAAVGTLSDPWEKAVAIERWVHANIRNKNFESTFATAADVARTLSGDCTEHSVLTAAMCRAAGIPARAVVGLVYLEQIGGFGFHQWNEVYVNRRWVALDSALDQSEVDAVHLKVSDSSLDGVSPFDTFSNVARLFKKTTIEVVESR